MIPTQAKQHEQCTQTAIEQPRPHRLTGAEILWATLVGEGVTRGLRLSGRRDSAGLRCAAQVSHPPRPGAPRAGRRAHGRRLRARLRQGGRGIATSGPGATNLVTGIATAMLDSIPMVCITGKVSSKVLGTDAFQEVDITGITLPVTKHNFLVTRPRTSRPRSAMHSRSRSPAGPARCWSTSPRTRSRPRRSSTLQQPSRAPYRPHPMLRVENRGLRRQPN